jgi:ubiquinone biosynthesis monooxygenase Coq7
LMGAASGALGDRWNLAFLAETERQVEEHLAGHLDQLSPADERSRAVVSQMRIEEGQHRATAVELGAATLPEPAAKAMRLFAKIMTTVAYKI